MNLKTLIIWLRYFWPVVPGVVAALGASWLFWGLGFMWFVVVPLAVGAAVSLFFSWVDMSAHIAVIR